MEEWINFFIGYAAGCAPLAIAYVLIKRVTKGLINAVTGRRFNGF